MKADNPLSQEFLSSYPVEAARVLEQVSVEHVVALFSLLPPATTAPVITSMMPTVAASCLELIETLAAAQLFAEMPIASIARIHRLLSQAKQGEVSAHLPEKMRSRLQRYLAYPTASAGILLDPKVDVLPERITVADAIRRVERFLQPARSDLYITDATYRLVGFIEIGRLLTSNHHATLRDVMNRKTGSISVNAPSASLLSHPGWSTRHRLPVVERDNTLAGVLYYKKLHEAVVESEFTQPRDPFGDMVSLASLYWISMSQLLDSVFGIPRSGEGER